ncbi:MAG: LEA type 2 family protein [Acidobacteriota bacterium]
MRNSETDNQSREAQTERSAFFCARLRVNSQVLRRVGLASAVLVLLTMLGAPVCALEEARPAVQLKGVSIEGVNWSNRSAQTKLSIAIDNPGPAFKMKDLSYRLKLNDKQAAEGKYDKEIQVPAHASATFDLPCDVDLSALPGVAWGVLAGGFEVHYDLETEFTVPLPLLNPRVKTSLGGDLSLAATVSGWSARIKESISSKQ